MPSEIVLTSHCIRHFKRHACRQKKHTSADTIPRGFGPRRRDPAIYCNLEDPLVESPLQQSGPSAQRHHHVSSHSRSLRHTRELLEGLFPGVWCRVYAVWGPAFFLLGAQVASAMRLSPSLEHQEIRMISNLLRTKLWKRGP